MIRDKTSIDNVHAVLQVSYNFSLPYEEKVQKDGLVYPVRVWRDTERGVSRMDTFGGRNILISTKVETHPSIIIHALHGAANSGLRAS